MMKKMQLNLDEETEETIYEMIDEMIEEIKLIYYKYYEELEPALGIFTEEQEEVEGDVADFTLEYIYDMREREFVEAMENFIKIPRRCFGLPAADP